MEKQKILTQCDSCGGTGLYCGYNEKKKKVLLLSVLTAMELEIK